MSTPTLLFIAISIGLANIMIFIMINRINLITKTVVKYGQYIDILNTRTVDNAKNIKDIALTMGEMVYQQAKEAGYDMSTFDNIKKGVH